MKRAIITQSRSTFSMTCGVALNIRVSAATIWSLLTDADGFPRWNSTVTRVEGRFARVSDSGYTLQERTARSHHEYRAWCPMSA